MMSSPHEKTSAPSHLAPAELLLDYAGGGIDPGYGLAVATQLAINAGARAEMARLQALGGLMLEAAPAANLAADALERALARLERTEQAPKAVVATDPQDQAGIPAPVCRLLPGPVASLPWQKVISGVEEYRFEVPGAHGKVSLLRIEPGRSMPRHTHRGEELTLVLEGHYEDALGRFARGDLALLDESVDHQPVAGSDQDCICLVVREAPLRLTGPIGRLLNPFIRF
ncbi:MAG: ChrR family anti-sigma-E factor [Alphaproteobacteria bacterium]|nr:ChrR family anti-sigma-E factor [Alphaproteobacteria bacterium]